MSGSFAGTPRLKAAYRSFVPSTTTDVSAFAWTSALLVGLLAGVVPLLSITTDLPPPALVVVAGIGYGAVILHTRTGFEGLASAVVVLSVFDLGIRLAEGPSIIPVSTIDLMAVDLVALVLLIVLVRSLGFRRSFRRPAFTGETLVATALCVFVVWTILSGIVANGESSLVPLLNVVDYLRYGLLFVLGVLLVRVTNPWCVVYPFVIAVAGNLAFALAQINNGRGFALYSLGESPSIILGRVGLGSTMVRFGSYAGGLVGHSREFTIILLLFVPLVCAVATRHSWLHRLGAVGSVAASVVVIRTAYTDAGWAALVLVGVLLTVTFGYAVLHDRHRSAALAVLTAGIGAVFVVISLAVGVVLRASADAAPDVPFVDTRTLPIRIEQYVTAIEVASRYPLFGLGSGNFYLMGEDFGLGGLRGIHGLPFSYLAATGFVGATAYVVGVTAVVVIAFRRFVGQTGSERMLWGALVCGMIGFHAYSLWDLAHLWDSALSALWLLMGVVVGARPQDSAPD